MTRTEAHPHRGRLQAQGGGVEESAPWARRLPLPAVEGRGMLRWLNGRLTSTEQARRGQAFAQAHLAIDRFEQHGGMPRDGRYPYSKSFPQPPDGDRRVDIEVHAGLAFVPPGEGASP